MTVESVTTVDDLVITNPAANTARGDGDDHLRLIKVAVKSMLAGVPGVMDGTPATLTIANSPAAIVPTVSVQYVDTFGSVASDDLDTITATNFYTGGFLWLRAAHTDRTVVVKHGADNITLKNDVDFSLDGTDKWLLLFYDGSNWIEVHRFTNGAANTLADSANTLTVQTVTRHSLGNFITPTAIRVQTLPTTDVLLGDTVKITNLASTKKITVEASDGTDILSFQNGHVVLEALQATPTGTAHWKITERSGGAAPSFAADLTADQTVNAATPAEVSFDAEDFDTNADFDTTGHRFTPTVPGKYRVEAQVQLGNLTASEIYSLALYKNGSTHRHTSLYVSSVGSLLFLHLTCLVEANGSTDYFECYVDSAADTSYKVDKTTVPSTCWFSMSFVEI